AEAGPIERLEETQQAAPVNEHDRQDRARLDRHVGQLRALPQPLLGDEQMPGARDRQERGDALDDAEKHGVESVRHAARPRSTPGLWGAILTGELRYHRDRKSVV